MVSVQHMDMDAIRPMRESVPNSLKISRSRPVAAEEENIFTTVSGTSSPGNPIWSVSRPIWEAIISRNPDALKIPTAIISATIVGMIFTTI